MMIIQIPYGKIIILMVILSISLMFFFFWLRKTRIKRKKKQLEKLQEKFSETSKLSIEKPPEEDKKLLERLSERIKSASESGKEKIEFSLQDDVTIRIEAPDVISLDTSRSTLHKSFPDITFQKIERTKGKARLYIESRKSLI